MIDDDNLYDEYVVSLEEMSLRVYFPNYSKDPFDVPLVNDISFDIRIENCLEPKHELYPTLRINFDIDKDIELEADLYCLKKFFRITDFM